jgi:acylphosphatase
MKRAHLLISGRVQGVWFRADTREMAERLGIKGWVRNLSDGRLEAIFEGNDNAIKKMIEWCRRGPPLARVRKVEIEWEEPEGFDRFKILY